ncbi:helix-turn-helix transcriptional regulator [Methylomonas sp. MS20]|uniref:helix-turn-helix transcriptional regulator n=1 Tax=unclassified Methylomonas TaxID=2608980 RepID=UPI0028A39A88|nr:transcriptional regulator [Methylomonas sp. MV1]MDT4328738.1 transcriptional regulator [Methylomonas sp. MV1]
MSENASHSLVKVDHIIGNPNKTPPIPARIPVSKRKWYAMVSAGEAPKPIKIGRGSFWKKSDIDRLVSKISGEVTA